jgi:hypothetical protein
MKTKTLHHRQGRITIVLVCLSFGCMHACGSKPPSAAKARNSSSDSSSIPKSEATPQPVPSATAPAPQTPAPSATPKATPKATPLLPCDCALDGPSKNVQNYIRIKCNTEVYLVPSQTEIETEDGKICRNETWVKANLFNE